MKNLGKTFQRSQKWSLFTAGTLPKSLAVLLAGQGDSRWALPGSVKCTDMHWDTLCQRPVPCGRKTKCTGRENAVTGFPAGQRGAQDCKRHYHNHSVTRLCEGVLNTWTPASSRQGECLVPSITAIGETFPRAARELFNLQNSVQTQLVSDKYYKELLQVLIKNMWQRSNY